MNMYQWNFSAHFLKQIHIVHEMKEIIKTKLTDIVITKM